MEKGGQQANENQHDLNLNVGNDLSIQLWNNHEDSIDDLLGDEDYSYSDPDDEDYVPGRKQSKRVKPRPTKLQSQELMAAYDRCTHPDAKTLRALGTKIGMAPRRVKFWFQNRRCQMKNKAQLEENKQIQPAENASLLAENQSLRQATLTQSCITCGGGTLPSNPSSEKQRLLIENARLKDEYLRASAIHSKIICASAFTGPAAPWIISSSADREALLHHAETSMKQFLVLATKGEPMWLPTIHGEMLNYVEYGARMSPFLPGLGPKGFVVEATKDTTMVWGRAADLIGILMDTARWSETFPGIVASVVPGDVVSTGIFGSCDGHIQLMNAKLWVQSPRVPNRTVNILRFGKLISERQWAVMDVSVDGILGQEVMPARYMDCRLLPSGCLIEDNNGYCKVTCVVHAEYDDTTMPNLFKPLFLTGQALGARRWLASLQTQRNYIAALQSSCNPRNNNTAAAGILKLAQQMMVDFYKAISGPVRQPQVMSNINEWFGSVGTGVDRFDAAVRMVTWKKAGGVVLSATTTLWLSTPPECLFNYFRNEQFRGEWDIHFNCAVVNELGAVATGYLAGNVVSVLRITDAANNEVLILKEERTDVSGSLVVYSPIGERTIHAVMAGGDNASVFLLPSGFAILPDGHGNLLATPPSTSTAPAYRHNSRGSLLTMAYQILLPSSRHGNLAAAFDDISKRICHAIEKIKITVKADTIIPI